MTTVTITLADDERGNVSVHSSFKPAIGAPCTPAQSLALDLIGRAKRCSCFEQCPAAEIEEAIEARDKGLARLVDTSLGR